MKFIASDSFWELFPEAEIGLILFKDIKMEEKSNREIRDKLDDANEKALDYLTKPVFSENPVIKVWRDAFRKFKTKKGARCSIEALLKRVSKDKDVGSINPQTIFKDIKMLQEIGLDLPFSMKINQLLGFDDHFITYEGLVEKL